jgi:hypothetical protein
MHTQTFFADPSVDRLLAMTVALAAEVHILRDRNRALEGVLRDKGLIEAAEIEAWQPAAGDQAASDAERDLFVRSVLDPLAKP